MNRMIASTISPGDHRGREADLPFGVQDPAPGRDQNEEERSQQFGEQPAGLELGIVELRPRPELEREQTLSSRDVVGREIWVPCRHL